MTAVVLPGAAAGADAICRDGAYSYAEGQGACSHHGGVDEFLIVDRGDPGDMGGPVGTTPGLVGLQPTRSTASEPWYADKPWLIYLALFGAIGLLSQAKQDSS